MIGYLTMSPALPDNQLFQRGPPAGARRAATSQGCQAGRARRQQSPVGRMGLQEG
ncbi:MAG: hypothetical protein GX463_00770 [Methanothrix sp.]|nr:hypothetical protein [Methanothrix sp.]